MALTAALKAQIAAWYKALQEQIPDFIPRAPQRQMIADVAKTLAGEEGRHLAIEAPTGVGKTLSYLIPGIAIALMTFCASMFGDAIRDLLDPRLKGGVGSYNTKKLNKVLARLQRQTAEAGAEDVA